jgi:hypothetical protein
MSDLQPAGQPATDSNTIAVLTWVGTLFFWFIPSLIVYLIKKDDEFVQDTAKEALNWSITVTIAYFACAILTFVIIGALLMPVVGIVHLVFCILGAVNVSKGQTYRLPFALRLIR